MKKSNQTNSQSADVCTLKLKPVITKILPLSQSSSIVSWCRGE